MPIRIRARRALLSAALLASIWPGAAGAFSQITDEENPTPTREGIVTVPLPPVPGATPPASPSPPVGTPTAQDTPAAPAAPAGMPETPDPDAAPQAPTDVAPARILYDEDDLPAPVRDLRRKLIEIAKSGEVDRLRPYIETGADPTTLSLAEDAGDPIQILKDASGDGNGVELLAILLETLEAGHVHVEGDGADEIYVWPYFTQVDLSKLAKPQLVELFELVTAGDYQRMLANGSYDFYRIGISPDGRFEFFVAGD